MELIECILEFAVTTMKLKMRWIPTTGVRNFPLSVSRLSFQENVGFSLSALLSTGLESYFPHPFSVSHTQLMAVYFSGISVQTFFRFSFGQSYYLE